MSSQDTRQPIANLEAEEHVLGALMLSPAAVDAVQAVGLDPAHFYRETHAKIYRAILGVHHAGAPADVVAVVDRLTQSGDLVEVGGKERVQAIASLVPVASNAPHHARLLIRVHALRRAETAARQVVQAASSGRPLDDVERDLAELAAALELDRATTGTRYRVTPAAEFLEAFEEQAAALAGVNGETLIPAGGLLILGGEAGAGKTTLALDLACHLAAGVTAPWLPDYPINRPVRVLIIENEGPRPQFRDKLRAKRETWQGPSFVPQLEVLEEPWARFSFASPNDRRFLREYTIAKAIELVMCDPLDSLGIQGAGTPEDTRTFVQYLRECRLHDPSNPLAYLLLHHFGKLEHGTINGRLRGAWGDHADALLGLEQLEGHASKLTFGKLRHATPPAKQTAVLAWRLETRSFQLHDDTYRAEQAAARADEAADAASTYVLENPGRSSNQIRQALGELLGLKRDTVSNALARLEHAGQVESRPGPRRSSLWYTIGDAPQATLDNLTPPPTGEDGVQSGELTPAPNPATSPETTLLPRRGRSSGGEVEGRPPHPTPPTPGEDTSPGAELERSSDFVHARQWLEAGGWRLPLESLRAELAARGLTFGEVLELERAAGVIQADDFGGGSPA